MLIWGTNWRLSVPNDCAVFMTSRDTKGYWDVFVSKSIPIFTSYQRSHN